MTHLFDPQNTKIRYKYTQFDQKHFNHNPMSSNFEHHSAFMPLAQEAFAQHAYAPTEAILLAAAKNLARLQTSAIANEKRPDISNFDELLKRLADV